MTKAESGRILTRLAKRRGLSAYALARALEISHTTAYGWLEGKFRPGPRHLAALARLLEVPMSEISDDGIALTEHQQQQVTESVLEVALAALDHGDLVAATEEEIGAAAPWDADRRAAIAGITPESLKALLDVLAEGEFLALSRRRQLEVLERFLKEKPEPTP